MRGRANSFHFWHKLSVHLEGGVPTAREGAIPALNPNTIYYILHVSDCTLYVFLCV